MASTDAKPFPLKNTAYRVTLPILDAEGDLVAGATGLDSEVSKDGGTFADCTNEATEIATASGLYYLDLTSTEMNADTVAIVVKTTSTGAKTTALVLYPLETGDIPEVSAIKAKTDNLPSDPADQSIVDASFATVNTKLDAIITDLPLDTTDLNAIADSLLRRDWTSVTGEASYSVLQALRMLRCAWDTASGTLTVRKENGTDVAWTRTLSVDASASPIVGAE